MSQFSVRDANKGTNLYRNREILRSLDERDCGMVDSSNLPTVATPTLICVLTSLQILFDPVVVGSGVFLTREVEVRNPDLADLRIVVTYKVMFTKYGNHPDTPPFFTSCARLMKVVECREGARKYPPTTHFPVCDSG